MTVNRKAYELAQEIITDHLAPVVARLDEIKDMVWIRDSDGAVIWDSRIDRMIDEDRRELLLLYCQDHIVDDDGSETIDWAGVKTDLEEFKIRADAVPTSKREG